MGHSETNWNHNIPHRAAMLVPSTIGSRFQYTMGNLLCDAYVHTVQQRPNCSVNFSLPSPAHFYHPTIKWFQEQVPSPGPVLHHQLSRPPKPPKKSLETCRNHMLGHSARNHNTPPSPSQAKPSRIKNTFIGIFVRDIPPHSASRKQKEEEGS